MIENYEEIRWQKRKRNRNRRKIKNIIILIMFLLIAVITSIITIHYFLENQISEDSDTPASIGDIPIFVDILPENIQGRIGQEMKIKYIVVHETGNVGSNADAAAHNSYIHKQASQSALSWHYTVDDSEIYKHLPDNEVGFHAGDKFTENGGNMNGIGIEMCVNSDGDYEKTLENAAKLIHYLMTEYDLKIEDIKTHQDFSGKTCPERLIINERWEEFLQMIEEIE